MGKKKGRKGDKQSQDSQSSGKPEKEEQPAEVEAKKSVVKEEVLPGTSQQPSKPTEVSQAQPSGGDGGGKKKGKKGQQQQASGELTTSEEALPATSQQPSKPTEVHQAQPSGGDGGGKKKGKKGQQQQASAELSTSETTSRESTPRLPATVFEEVVFKKTETKGKSKKGKKTQDTAARASTSSESTSREATPRLEQQTEKKRTDKQQSKKETPTRETPSRETPTRETPPEARPPQNVDQGRKPEMPRQQTLHTPPGAAAESLIKSQQTPPGFGPVRQPQPAQYQQGGQPQQGVWARQGQPPPQTALQYQQQQAAWGRQGQPPMPQVYGQPPQQQLQGPRGPQVQPPVPQTYAQPPQQQVYGQPPQQQVYGQPPQQQVYGQPPQQQVYGQPPQQQVYGQPAQQQVYEQPPQQQQRPRGPQGQPPVPQAYAQASPQQQGPRGPQGQPPTPQTSAQQGPWGRQGQPPMPQTSAQQQQGPWARQGQQHPPPTTAQYPQQPSQQQQRGQPSQPQHVPQQPRALPSSASSQVSTPRQSGAGTPVQVQQATTDISRMRLSAGAEQSRALVVPGTKGRKIKVEVNHLPLLLGNLKLVYHYDVAFKPETPKKLLRVALEEFRLQHFRNRYPAFDGRKNMYFAGRRPNDQDEIEGSVTVVDEDRQKEFHITIKCVNEIDLGVLRDKTNPLRVIQAALQSVDIVLRSAPVISCIPVGRSFFRQSKEGQIITLGNGMEMYNGFYQTAVRGWKTLLNVDVAHKAFPIQQEVTAAVCEVLTDRFCQFGERDLQNGLNDANAEKVCKFLKTLKVEYQIPRIPSSKRVHRINGLGASARNAMFQAGGVEMSVEEYFLKQKNYKLRYPCLQTLWVGSKDRPDKILIPMELCIILPGQALNRKMTEEQTSKMIKYAATDTTTRKRKIMDAIRTVDYNGNASVREFGFNIGNQFERIDARVLEPPRLEYRNKKPVTVRKGTWRPDKCQFFTPSTKGKWTILNVDRSALLDRDVAEFISRMKKISQELGMGICTDPDRPFGHVRNTHSVAGIKEYFKSVVAKKYDLIVVVVPNSGPQYSFVKSAAELMVGCLTQCLKRKTLNKMNDQTVWNILLKVNSKLNGLNHRLINSPLLMRSEGPVMLMGADVTHPSPDAQHIPSVAAVTASHDPNGFCYNICWRLQPPKVEIISDLQNIVKEQLMTFYRRTNHSKPTKIIFFRDGVSEGQFEEVKQAEIAAIQAACSKLEGNYQPKITFLVVQKRHHTRLFPTRPEDSEDRNFNVPAGTIVDTDITNPVMQDFYLVSHASIQGVAKPTKYCTLHDDNDFDHDTIEELTYHLCHMFTRCNRSVSYPAPTYYAHLAAARAKVYIENSTLNLEKLQQEQDRFKILREIREDCPMFFV